MPGPDPTHWLHRLTSEEWLSAAATELAHAETASDQRARRAALAHARRAAGMAWNAVLIDHPDEGAGRSYMDHLHALAANASTDEVRAAAGTLCERTATPPVLVHLRPPGAQPDRELLQAARVIIDYAQRIVRKN
jgi:HEPN domain-containing protein